MALYSEGLINQLALRRANLVTLTVLERSQELLSVVEKKVATSEDAFHKLFKVISQDPTMEELCSLLKKAMGGPNVSLPTDCNTLVGGWRHEMEFVNSCVDVRLQIPGKACVKTIIFELDAHVGDNKESSMNPTIFRDGSQVEWLPSSDGFQTHRKELQLDCTDVGGLAAALFQYKMIDGITNNRAVFPYLPQYERTGEVLSVVQQVVTTSEDAYDIFLRVISQDPSWQCYHLLRKRKVKVDSNGNALTWRWRYKDKTINGCVDIKFQIPENNVVSGIKLMLYGCGDGSTVNPTFTINGKQVEWFKLSLPEKTFGGILKIVIQIENQNVIVYVAVFSKLVIPIFLFCPLKFELLLGASSDKQTKAVIEAALEDTLNKLEETEEDKYLGQTPLEGNAEIAGLLLDKGADPNHTNNKVREKVGLQQAETPPRDLPHQESGDSAIGSEGRPSFSSPTSPLSPLSPLELSLLEIWQRSVACTVITTVSKLVVPMLNPIIGFTPLMEASRQGNVEIAGLLLDKGADPNCTNNEGWTALMVATNNGRYGTVDILLQKGANPEMQDHSGRSALMAAVYKRHDEVALRIIQAGATPHLQDENHTNAILLAIATNEQDRVVEALLERVEDPSQLDLQDSDGETVLIFACKNRNLELVKRLLSMKANPNLCNNHGETPVLISTKWGDTETVQELLDNDADPNMGNTHPLMVAINLGHKEIAKLLVVNGADICKEHEGGVLAFEMAELRNFTDLARRLNPQQFTSRTPRDVLRLTIKSLATVQKHLSLVPLMFVKTDK